MKQLAHILGLLMLGLVITGPNPVMAAGLVYKPGDTWYMHCHRRCHHIYKPMYMESKRIRENLWKRVNKSGSQHLTAQEYIKKSARWEKREIWALDMFKKCEQKCDAKYPTKAKRQCKPRSHAACD